MLPDINVFYRLKGYRVKLKVDNEEYEGTVLDVLPETSCVSLGKVFCTDNTRYTYLKFYTYEIESFSVVEAPKKNEKKILKKPSRLAEDEGPRLVKLRSIPMYTKNKSDSNVTDKKLLTNENFLEDFKVSNEDDSEVPDYESDDDDTEPLPNVRSELPHKTIIIDKIDDDFYEAVSYISNLHLIGISVEGVNIGRKGKICWISISTQKCIYLFDIYVLQKEAFDKGLKTIFEKMEITKIIHDCRQLSDALFHQFGVEIKNVFDTQVADAFVYYKKNNRMPNHVRALWQCLMEYLHLEEKYIDISKVRENFEEEELSVWTIRPLPNRLEKVAIKHVIYLRDLRIFIFEHLLSEVNEGIDIYLNILRECSEEELSLCPSSPHILPSAFQTLQYKNNNRKAIQYFLQSNGRSGFSENISEIENPYNSFNKDNLHKKFLEKNEATKKSSISTDNADPQKFSATKDAILKTEYQNTTRSTIDSSNNMIPRHCEGKATSCRRYPQKRLDWPIKNNKFNSECISDDRQ